MGPSTDCSVPCPVGSTSHSSAHPRGRRPPALRKVLVTLDTVLQFIPIAVLGLALAARPEVRLKATLLALFWVLAVFPSTASRLEFSASATYVLVILLAAVAMLSGRRRVWPVIFFPYILWVFLCEFLVWDDGFRVNGTFINLFFPIAAWVAGSYLAPLVRGRQSAMRLLAGLVLAIILFEGVVTVLQTAGLEIFSLTGRSLELEGGRANGTFSHPSVVGKVIILVLMFVLPLTRSDDRMTSRLALFATIASVVPVGFSQSRSNFVALIAMLMIWFIIQPRTGQSQGRLLAIAGIGIAGVIFANDIIARFQADPAGGQRAHFMEVAIIQFKLTPWFGVGPGQYIPVVGQFDLLTSQGWPVHNVFMLYTVELGLVGAVLYYLPLALVALRSVRLMMDKTAVGDSARSIIASLPAIILIGVTGWGLADPQIMALWFMAFAWLNSGMRVPAVQQNQDDLGESDSGIAARPGAVAFR